MDHVGQENVLLLVVKDEMQLYILDGRHGVDCIIIHSFYRYNSERAEIAMCKNDIYKYV